LTPAEAPSQKKRHDRIADQDNREIFYVQIIEEIGVIFNVDPHGANIWLLVCQSGEICTILAASFVLLGARAGDKRRAWHGKGLCNWSGVSIGV
jgi:hypothetical protein